MRRTGFLVSACALALVFGTTGCDDTRDGDDGGIMLMDSGPPTVDSGPPMVDSGPPAGSCAISTIMALPAACTPRCTNATQSAAAACGMDVTCLQNALNADTTPAIPISTPDPSLNMLNCANCYSLQVTSCIVESCPTEFQAFAMCPMGSDCSTQEMALDACVTANNAALQSCANPRVTACFGATGGFLPATPRTLQVPERLMSFIARYDFNF